MAVVDKSLFGH